MAVITPTDRPKSFRNRWVIGCFGSIVLLIYEFLKRLLLLLRTPGPVPFGTCICSNVQTILSWPCHVYGPFEFRTSLGTSILLLLACVIGASVTGLSQISSCFSSSSTHNNNNKYNDNDNNNYDNNASHNHRAAVYRYCRRLYRLWTRGLFW